VLFTHINIIFNIDYSHENELITLVDERNKIWLYDLTGK